MQILADRVRCLVEGQGVVVSGPQGSINLCDAVRLCCSQDKKPKLSMGESMKFLFNSRYVRDLATLVVAYGVSINLVEVTWKGKIKAQVSDTRANLCWSFQPTRFMVATGPGIQ